MACCAKNRPHARPETQRVNEAEVDLRIMIKPEPAFVFPLVPPLLHPFMNRFWFHYPKLRITSTTLTESINNGILSIVDCACLLTRVWSRAGPRIAPKCCNYCPALFCTPSTIIPPFIMTRNPMRFERVDFINARTLPQTSRTATLTSDDAIKFQQCGSTNSHFDNAELRPTQAVSSELRHSAF